MRFPTVREVGRAGLERPDAAASGSPAPTPSSGRILIALPIFSFFCLPFVSLFPAIAAERPRASTRSASPTACCTPCSASAPALGALSIGTVLAGFDRMRLTRIGFVGFAVAIGVFGVLRQPALAYPVVFVLGAFYFGTTTSMLTVLQETVDDEVRGRVMALWFMGFGGTVPLGGLVFGPMLDATNGTVVLGIGAGVVDRCSPGGATSPPSPPEPRRRTADRSWPSDAAGLRRRPLRRAVRRRARHGSWPCPAGCAGASDFAGVLDGLDAIALDLPGFGGASPEPADGDGRRRLRRRSSRPSLDACAARRRGARALLRRPGRGEPRRDATPTASAPSC